MDIDTITVGNGALIEDRVEQCIDWVRERPGGKHYIVVQTRTVADRMKTLFPDATVMMLCAASTGWSDRRENVYLCATMSFNFTEYVESGRSYCDYWAVYVQLCHRVLPHNCFVEKRIISNMQLSVYSSILRNRLRKLKGE